MRQTLSAVVAVVAGATAVAALVAVAPASAATRVMPGSFTGYGFDACQAPSQQKMDVWLERSPYWAVGIYTSGVNRYCDEQDHLSPSWVSQQARNGWRLLPLHVGLQAACADPDRHWKRISSNPAGDFAKAREQGRKQARDAAAAAKHYGIARRSTLWYDLEHFDVTRTRCRESAVSMVSAWTRKLHDLGYRSGFYSSASSGIKMLDDSRVDKSDHRTMPDQVWIARWSGVPGDVSGAHGEQYVRDDAWMPHSRVHQYLGGHDERHGGVTVNIDSNYLDVGRGSVAPKPGRHCKVRVDFPLYRHLVRHDRGDQVAAAQCFLHQRGAYDGTVHGRYTRATKRAVKRFQARHALPVDGEMTRRTWTALVSRGGGTPLMKVGSASKSVRRLQRALNAAAGAGLDVTGVFTGATGRATRGYQQDRGLHRTGVVTDEVWQQLRAGRR